MTRNREAKKVETFAKLKTFVVQCTLGVQGILSLPSPPLLDLSGYRGIE